MVQPLLQRSQMASLAAGLALVASSWLSVLWHSSSLQQQQLQLQQQQSQTVLQLPALPSSRTTGLTLTWMRRTLTCSWPCWRL